MMKKTAAILLTGVLVLEAGSTSAFAAGRGHRQRAQMRSEQKVNRAVEQYADMIRRICILHLENYDDTQDIFQNVFLKYALSSVVFESEEHEKA